MRSVRNPCNRVAARTGLLLLATCLLFGACAGPLGSPRREAPPAEEEAFVERYRVQIHLTPNRSVADAYVEEALAWWDALPESGRPESLRADELPVEVAWKAPYYRVQLGAFETREAAQELLDLAAERFPGALIAPERVPLSP